MVVTQILQRTLILVTSGLFLAWLTYHVLVLLPTPPSSSSSLSDTTVPKMTIIIIGSGLAGLSASLSALSTSPNVKVHLLDRAAKPGGNSIKASSGINGAGTTQQLARGIVDSSAAFYADTVRSAGRRWFEEEATTGSSAQELETSQNREKEVVDRPALAHKLADDSADALAWLGRESGADLSVVAALGGHGTARTHRGVKGTPGFSIISGLLEKLKAEPRFSLTTGAEVTGLVTGDDDDDVDDRGGERTTGRERVSGVRYRFAPPLNSEPTSQGETTQQEDGPSPKLKEITAPASAVVLASGGFAGDSSGLLAQHRPDLAGLPSTNDARPASHMNLLSPLGAAFVDMDSVQIHPTGFVDPADRGARYKILAAEALRGEGGIMLDSRGRRFVNEMETREVVSRAVMEHVDQELVLPTNTAATVSHGTSDEANKNTTRQWEVTVLLDHGASEALGAHLGFYTFKKLMRRVKVHDLSPTIVESIDTYASAVAAGRDDAFGRKTFGHWRLPPGEANRDMEVCVGQVTPVTHFTMGGVAFNTRAQVLREDESVIEGLWAAGEITGGLHGDNRLGGSSLLECVVFGRTAGEQAAKAAAGMSEA